MGKKNKENRRAKARKKALVSRKKRKKISQTSSATPFFLQQARAEYAQTWSDHNAKKFREDGHYSWMADFVNGCDKILEIGTGDGSGTLELLKRGHSIISIDENIACLKFAQKNLEMSGFDAELIERETVVQKGHMYTISYADALKVRRSPETTLLLESDILNDDNLLCWLEENLVFDGIVCWLMGTHKARKLNAAIPDYVESPGDYRLFVQNKVYELSDRVLRPGGVLHIVDRGEPSASQRNKTSTLYAHRDQACVTSLQIDQDLQERIYQEPESGMNMGLTTPLSGRLPNMKDIAFCSIIAQKPNNPNVLELYNALKERSNLACFVDDGGTPSKVLPKETLVSDFHLIAGTVIPCKHYKEIETEAANWRTRYTTKIGDNIERFHTVEIVNPNSKTVWRGIDISTRKAALSDMFEILMKYSEAIPTLHIGRKQYEELMQIAGERKSPSNLKWKDPQIGLETVFYKNIATKIIPPENGQLILLQDQDSRRSEEQRAIYDDTVPVWKQSITYMPSVRFAGLQLADLAAYTLNRMYHSAHRIKKGTPGPFDELFLDFTNELMSKKINVLEG